MSEFSTIKITREKAKAYIITRILDMYDEELEQVMDIILEDRLYNCKIVDDNEKNDNICL